jgi:hypothetical protein
MATPGASTQGSNQAYALAAHHIAIDDAVAAWQSKPRVQSRWLDTYVNYMVLGTLGFARLSHTSY